MIEVYPDIVELVGAAVQNFESNQYVPVPRDLPIRGLDSVEFVPYLEDSAAYDAMANAGIDALSNPEMQNLLVGAIRIMVKDFDQIKQQRREKAQRLNSLRPLMVDPQG